MTLANRKNKANKTVRLAAKIHPVDIILRIYNLNPTLALAPSGG